MPRKQRFKPSRKPKLAEGTQGLYPVKSPPPTRGVDPETDVALQPQQQPLTQSQSPLAPAFRHLRGRDAVIDD